MTPTTLFITGTDTGVGKTRVACALAAAWTFLGRRIAVMKPAETGWTDAAGSDAAALRAAAGREDLALDLVCPFRYPLPAAPATAAHLDGLTPPSLPALIDAHQRLSVGAELVIVEGAGGLLVPLAPGLLFADLAATLNATLLVVAATRLGTLNHTLLTLEAAQHRGLRVAGVVLNQRHPIAGPEEVDVPRLLAAHGRVPLLGQLPHGPDALPTASALAQLALDHLAPAALWEALGAIDRAPAP